MSRPDLRRYSVTTFDPGARLVFTHGLRVSPRSNAFFATRPAPIITLGFDVLVQLVIAAMTTDAVLERRVRPAPRPRRRRAAGGRRHVRRAGRFGALLRRRRHHRTERRPGNRSSPASARRDPAAASGRRGTAPRSRDRARWFRCRPDPDRRLCGTALRLGVRLDQRDLLGLAAGQPQVVERHLVDREDRDGRAILGAHVAERRAIRDRQVLEARSRRTRRTCRRRRACAASR